MPLSVTTVYSGPFTPNGVTTIFPFDFKALDPAEVSVTDSRGDPISGLDYAVEIAAEGGNVVFGTAPEIADLASFFIASIPTFEQDVEFTPVGIFNPRTLQTPFDRTAVRDAWLKDRVDRAISFPMGEGIPVLPVAADRAGRFLAFDAGGDVVAASGTGSDGAFRTDVAASGGAALVGLPYGTVADAIKYVTPQMFGAAGTGVADSTAAIQAAIDSNVAEVQFPPGNYVHGNLTFNNDYQRLVGSGAKLIRNANGTTVTVSARGNKFLGIRFSGGGFTGNNITVTGPEASFQNCDSVETPGRALLADSDGGNLLVDGGIWNTTDATGTGYDIELKHTGVSSSLYSKLIGISTNASTGGVLIDGQGTVRLIGCQIGKFTVTRGGGFYVANRFNGAVSVQSAGNYFSANAFAGNVTFGDGAGANIGNIVFDASNGMQSGTTFTISSDVVESAFFLNQLIGVTLTLNGPNNDIWHGAIAYTPTMVGSGTSLGNGTLTGQYSRNGRAFNAYIQFAKGSTTNLGTTFGFTAPFKSSTRSQGNGICVVAGGIYNACADLAANTANITVFAGAVPIAGGLTATSPATWADGDQALLSVGGEYVA